MTSFHSQVQKAFVGAPHITIFSLHIYSNTAPLGTNLTKVGVIEAVQCVCLSSEKAWLLFFKH